MSQEPFTGGSMRGRFVARTIANNHIRIFIKILIKEHDIGGIVLKVGVNGNDQVMACVPDGGLEGRTVPHIFSVPDNMIGAGCLSIDWCVIGRGVINDDDFGIKSFEAFDASYYLSDGSRLVKSGNDERERYLTCTLLPGVFLFFSTFNLHLKSHTVYLYGLINERTHSGYL